MKPNLSVLAAASLAILVASILSFQSCRTQSSSELREATDAGTAPAAGSASGSGSATASGSGSGSTRFPPNSPCARACADTTEDVNWAVCYSCSCKAAFDGYLPRAEELSCSRGAELKIYRMVESGSEPKLEQVTTDVPECLNPDRLRQDCAPGSRMVQIVHDDVVFKTICKREVFIEDWRNLAVPFSETGIIAHNMRTGATCFWDDRDEVISGENQPEIDLTDGDRAKTDRFLAKYYRHEGDGCPACHDNDAFMYDPHLATSGWVTNTKITLGPYHLVHTDGVATSAGKSLVSEDAQACTSCHRISEGATCQRWAADSVGYTQNEMVQKIMQVSNGRWGQVKADDGFKWTFPYWMPDHNFMQKNATPPLTKAAWDAKYGLAWDTIQKCCADPSASGCEWEQIPMHPD